MHDPAMPTGRAPLRPRSDRPAFQRLRVLFAMVVRGMGTRFGRSAGGYVWAVAQPLGGILLLAAAFSVALRSPPLGTSFILFYATGVIPFQVFNAMSNMVSSAIDSNRGLLAYPVVSPLDTVFARFLLNVMTDFVVAVLLLSGIVLGLGLHVTLDLAGIVTAFALAALLGLGVGTLNCVLFGFFPTWKNVWAVLTRPLFIISGIFFIFEDVPAEVQDGMWYNPLIHVLGLMRGGFYGFYEPHYASHLYVLGIAGGTFVIGAYLLQRHASFLIEQ